MFVNPDAFSDWIVTSVKVVLGIALFVSLGLLLIGVPEAPKEPAVTLLDGVPCQKSVYGIVKIEVSSGLLYACNQRDGQLGWHLALFQDVR